MKIYVVPNIVTILCIVIIMTCEHKMEVELESSCENGSCIDDQFKDSEGYFLLVAEDSGLRGSNSEDSEIIDKLKLGQRIVVLKETGDWSYLRVFNSEQLGWVKRESLGYRNLFKSCEKNCSLKRLKVRIADLRYDFVCNKVGCSLEYWSLFGEKNVGSVLKTKAEYMQYKNLYWIKIKNQEDNEALFLCRRDDSFELVENFADVGVIKVD